MNLKFNDKIDIDYHDKGITYLKEKNDEATNFFSVVRLYNYLTKKKDYNLSFIASQKKQNFEGVNWTTDGGTSGFENFVLQSDEFVPSLIKNNKIDKDTNRFSHTFKNSKEYGLEFLTLCVQPEILKDFISKYQNEVKKYSYLGDIIEKQEFDIYQKINTEYVDAVYQQDVKKLYYTLEAFKYIADKNMNCDKVSINFERGFALKENFIKSISFFEGDKEANFN